MRTALYRSISVLALLAAACPTGAQPAGRPMVTGCAVHAAEAASRSGLSVDIVMRVMMAESGGNPRIVSSKGAMGCMQIMPATWGDLSARYNLGADPFDARRNMIGGAMYLAELTARYGMAGAIAAYNAGPGRYERYAAGRATLPAETIAYAARIGTGVSAASAEAAPPRWQEASLFLVAAVKSASAIAPTIVGRANVRRTVDPLFPLAKQTATESELSAAR